MRGVFIEAGQATDGPYVFNHGKFYVARFEDEWSVPSAMGESTRSLLAQCGWTPEHLWVMDCQTGEGAYFRPGGYAKADLDKHAIWVCPMFEPFLEWLWDQDTDHLDALPKVVELPDAPSAMYGYRRGGTATEYAIEITRPMNNTYPESELETVLGAFSRTHDEQRVLNNLHWLDVDRRAEIQHHAEIEEIEARRVDAERGLAAKPEGEWAMGTTNWARMAALTDARTTYRIIKREVTEWEAYDDARADLHREPAGRPASGDVSPTS